MTDESRTHRMWWRSASVVVGLVLGAVLVGTPTLAVVDSLVDAGSSSMDVRAGSSQSLSSAVVHPDIRLPVVRHSVSAPPYGAVLVIAGVLFLLARPPLKAHQAPRYAPRLFSDEVGVCRWGRAPPLR